MSQNLQQKYDELRQLEANAKHWLGEYEKQLEAERQEKITELEAELAEKTEQIKREFDQQSAGVRERVQKAFERLKYAAASWDMESWLGYPEEIAADAVMDSLRAGVIQRSFPATGINEVPLMLPFVDEGHVLIVSHGSGKAPARALLQSLALRALAMMSDGNTEFIFIDPFGMGANLPFQSLPQSIRGEMIYAEEDEINTQLRRLTDTIRKGQSNKRFVLCAADFPARFNEDAMQRLITVFQNGINNNIYALVHVDSEVPLPGGHDPSVLLGSASAVFMTDESVNARIDGEEYVFEPDSTPDKMLMDALVKKIGEKVNG